MTQQSDFLRMALILGLLSCVGPFAIDMYLPALPDIGRDLAAPVEAVQHTLTAFFIAFGVSQLFYGPAADMFGRKPPLYFGLLLFLVASIGSALAPTIEWLIVCRFFQGVGGAAVMSIPRAIIRDRYTGNQATRLTTTVLLIISISPMLAPLAGGAMTGPWGWRSVFYAVAVAAVLCLLLAWRGLPETLKTEDRVPLSVGELKQAFSVLLADRSFMGLVLISGLGTATFFMFLSASPFLYIEHYGLSTNQFSLAFALNALGFFCASQFAATLGARIGPMRVIRLCVLLFALNGLAMLVVFGSGFDSFFVLVAMLLVSNSCLGLALPTAMVMSLDDHGDIAGTAASFGGALQMILGAVGTLVISFFFDGAPFTLVIGVAACALLAQLMAILTLRRSAPLALQP